MKRNRVRDQVIASGVLIIAVIIIGGAGGGWLLLGWSDIASELVINGMVALGTLTLAVVAWVQNRDTIEQMRTDRAKPGVLKLIGHWVDPLLEEIERRQEKLEYQESKGTHTFSRVTPVRNPFSNAPFGKNELPDRILEEVTSSAP